LDFRLCDQVGDESNAPYFDLVGVAFAPAGFNSGLPVKGLKW
jgi:hypothetical protein